MSFESLPSSSKKRQEGDTSGSDSSNDDISSNSDTNSSQHKFQTGIHKKNKKSPVGRPKTKKSKKSKNTYSGPRFECLTKEHMHQLWNCAYVSSRKSTDGTFDSKDCVKVIDDLSNEDPNSWKDLFPVLTSQRLLNWARKKNTGFKPAQPTPTLITRPKLRPLLCYCLLAFGDQKKKLDCIDNETVESLKTYASKCNTVYSEDFNEKLKEIERSFRKSAGQMSTKSKQSEFALELNSNVIRRRPESSLSTIKMMKLELKNLCEQRQNIAKSVTGKEEELALDKAQLRQLVHDIAKKTDALKEETERQACLTMFKSFFTSTEEQNFAKTMICLASKSQFSDFPSENLLRMVDEAKMWFENQE